MSADKRHLHGTLIVVGGCLILGPDALLIKLTEEDSGLTTLFWRMLFFGTTVLLFELGFHNLRACEKGRAILRLDGVKAYGRSFYAMGRYSFLVTAMYCPLITLFLLANKYTTAANALVIVASSPFFSALLSCIFLHEKLPLYTAVQACVQTCVRHAPHTARKLSSRPF